MSQSRTRRTAIELLEADFVQEKASALGRLGRALDAALEALARFDVKHRDELSSAEQRALRTSLVAQAGVALWHFVVQREACSFHDVRHVLRDYRVPAEVVARMGLLPEPAQRPRKPDRRR
jgi:hypothetical protein